MPKARTKRSIPKTGAKEATYSGVTFRSRLECRWAIFFDLLGWNWDYEPAMFRITPHMQYLPDFYLPDQRLWVEVKGWLYLSRESISKIAASVAGRKRILHRSPPYGPADRLLVAGDMLAPTATHYPVHTLVRPGSPGKAALSLARVTPHDIEEVSNPWLEWDASGVPARKRPPENVRKLICTPGMAEGECATTLIENAYALCSTLAFDDAGPIIPAELRPFMGARFAGRPTS